MKLVYLIQSEFREPLYAMSATQEDTDSDPAWERAWDIAESIDGEVVAVFLDDPDIHPRPEETWPYSVYFPGGQEPAEVRALAKEDGIVAEYHDLMAHGHYFLVHAPDDKRALIQARVKLYKWQEENES